MATAEGEPYFGTPDGEPYYGDGSSTPSTSGGAVLGWGNDSVTATTVTRYLTPGFADGIALTVAEKSLRVPRAGTVKNLYVLHNKPTGNGNSIVYTLMVNGAASALTVGLISTGTTAADTVNTVAVVAGDVLDLRVTKAASVGNGNVGAEVTVEFS